MFTVAVITLNDNLELREETVAAIGARLVRDGFKAENIHVNVYNEQDLQNISINTSLANQQKISAQTIESETVKVQHAATYIGERYKSYLNSAMGLVQFALKINYDLNFERSETQRPLTNAVEILCEAIPEGTKRLSKKISSYYTILKENGIDEVALSTIRNVYRYRM